LRPERRRTRPGQPNIRENPNANPEPQEPSSLDRRPPNAAPMPTDRLPETRPNRLQRNPAENPTGRPESESVPGGQRNRREVTPNPRENPNPALPGPDTRAVPAPNVPNTRVRTPVRRPDAAGAPQQGQPGIPDARRRQPATPSLPMRPDGITPNVDSNLRGRPVLGPQQSPLQPRTRPAAPNGDFDLGFRLRPQSRRPGIDQGTRGNPPGDTQVQPPRQPQQDRQVPGIEGRGRQQPDANRPEARRNQPDRGRPPAAKPEPKPSKNDE
jgi:hypothetical protein